MSTARPRTPEGMVRRSTPRIQHRQGGQFGSQSARLLGTPERENLSPRTWVPSSPPSPSSHTLTPWNSNGPRDSSPHHSSSPRHSSPHIHALALDRRPFPELDPTIQNINRYSLFAEGSLNPDGLSDDTVRQLELIRQYIREARTDISFFRPATLFRRPASWETFVDPTGDTLLVIRAASRPFAQGRNRGGIVAPPPSAATTQPDSAATYPLPSTVDAVIRVSRKVLEQESAYFRDLPEEAWRPIDFGLGYTARYMVQDRYWNLEPLMCALRFMHHQPSGLPDRLRVDMLAEVVAVFHAWGVYRETTYSVPLWFERVVDINMAMDYFCRETLLALSILYIFPNADMDKTVLTRLVELVLEDARDNITGMGLPGLKLYTKLLSLQMGLRVKSAGRRSGKLMKRLSCA